MDGRAGEEDRIRAVAAVLAVVFSWLLSPVAAVGQQNLPWGGPPELFGTDQLYVVPEGVFHASLRGSLFPLVGDGDAAVPVNLAMKFGVTEFAQVELELRDRYGVDVEVEDVDPLDPFRELPTDTVDDARTRSGLRIALPAAPVDVISVSGSVIYSLRGRESAVVELSVGMGHRLGADGPIVLGQLAHRRGGGTGVGPGGRGGESTGLSGAAMVQRGGVLWSLEGLYRFRGDGREDGRRIIPAVYRSGPVSFGLGVPIGFGDGAEAGLSVTAGLTLGG